MKSATTHICLFIIMLEWSWVEGWNWFTLKKQNEEKNSLTLSKVCPPRCKVEPEESTDLSQVEIRFTKVRAVLPCVLYDTSCIVIISFFEAEKRLRLAAKCIFH